MAVLNQDTRLVMTILFVGMLSGANVYAYAMFGIGFPYGPLAHSVLFGLGTVGSIMVMKALFDLALNDRIEMFLLDRKITAYWERKSRDEQQRKKLTDTMKQYNTAFSPTFQTGEDNDSIGNEFLTALQ